MVTSQPDVVVTQSAPDALPARPALTFSPPVSHGDSDGGRPGIRSAQVVRTRNDDNPWRVRANVATGGRRRLLLAVYFVDGSGDPLSVPGAAAGPAVGAWVDDPTSEDHGGSHGGSQTWVDGHGAAPTASIDLPRPRFLDDVRHNRAAAQFSLFDDGMTEVARVVVPLGRDGSGFSHGSADGRSSRWPR